MKQFFQGLVLGAVLMYGYVYHGAGILGLLQNWFGTAGSNFRHDRMREEADKALQGFLFRHDQGQPTDAEPAHG